MRIIRSIEDFKSLEDEICRCKMAGFRLMFRGQADASWPLQTTLFRSLGDSIKNDGVWKKYVESYKKFKEYAISRELLNWKPDTENEDFYILSTARHLGFNCHLLDWSASHDIAILFACLKHQQTEGALWILSTKQHINQTPIRESPFDVEVPMLICKEFDLIPNGKGLNELPLGRLRRFRQDGFLSVIPHSFLTKPFCSLLDKEHSLCKISIASEAKGELLKYINSRGKDSDFLYGTPDAEEERAVSFITELNNSLKS